MTYSLFVNNLINIQEHNLHIICIYVCFPINLGDGFKTQPPVDRFRPVSIVLNNDNHPEPPVNQRLGFEAAP